MEINEAYRILEQFHKWRRGAGRVHHPERLDEAIQTILDYEDQ